MAEMSFYPIQIEPTPGFGFSGGPEFSTDIKSLQSGREKRNGDWAECRHKYTAPFQNITNDAYLNIKQVFLVCRGRLHSFLHRDWADFEALNEEIGVGDGGTRTFQLKKISSVAAATYERKITAPSDDVVVTINGVNTPPVIDPLTGLITFGSPPPVGAVVRWSGTFFVRVRFDIDYLPFSVDDLSNGKYVSNGSIDLIEVIDE